MMVNSEGDSTGHTPADGTSIAFTPVELGPVTVRNRIFVPAHTTNFGLDNLPTDRHTAYHEARARGGAGLIIMESLRVHATSLGKPQGLAAYDPRCVEPLTRIAEAVHRHRARVFGQIIHLGRQIDGDALRLAPWGPSPIAWDAAATAPHAMSEDDIAEVVAGHVTSAHHVLAAGFDGLEVHVGHGHLLQQFLSPATNARTDGYGGSEANRMRFAVEVLTAVRDAVGPDVCLGMRVSADEYAHGGLTLDDMERIVPALANLVDLDFVNVSHSAYHDSYALSTQMADMTFPADMFRHLAPTIARSLRAGGHSMPVMAVCKFRTVAEAEQLLAGGDVDMVGMARAHVADPDLVVKARSRRAHETRTCIGCNQGCAGFLEKGLPITCVVNPTVGRERTWTPNPVDDPAADPKRVLVVGGGPAGLEAAWVAAARGHRVNLVEAGPRLGGTLRLLEHMPKRHDFLALVDEQIAACRRYGVDMRLNTTVDIDSLVSNERPAGPPDHVPDHLIVATGARLQPVAFPGGGTGLTLAEALTRSWSGGERVAVYDLVGDWSTMGVVEHLADQGVAVTYLTPVAGYGWKITVYSKTALTSRLREARVAIRPLRSGRSFVDGVFTVEDLSTGELESLEVDAVVAAGNPMADDVLADKMAALGPSPVGGAPTVTVIGDGLAPRTALEAVYEGHRIAREL
jgi:2,4-dienoyl-CoA reductase-like NADH-dependent reductase (Old Yellow Enzyme family)